MTPSGLPDPDGEYRRLALTAWMLMASAVPMTAVAVLVDLHSVVSGFPSLYRWLFLGVAVVAAFFCLLVYDILQSPRTLTRPDAPKRSIPAQVASFATLLVTIPFSVLLLGFADRLALGGTALDYGLFLGIALVLWAVFYPGRGRFEEWVRMRTEGRG